MKKLVFTSLAIAALGSCAGTGSRSALDGKMAELNENLSRSGEFVDAFHGRVSELRSRLATAREDSLKSEIEYSLYKEYQNFNTDSAKAWMTLMMEHPDAGFPIDVLQAWKYAIDGDKDNFKKMFEAFDPKYALNMDGGGSSTMCVSGLGDESSNVVNYPCDDGKATHSGERTVQSFLYVVKK